MRKAIAVMILLLIPGCSAFNPNSSDMPNGIGKNDLPPRGLYCACIDVDKALTFTQLCIDTIKTVDTALPQGTAKLYYHCED